MAGDWIKMRVNLATHPKVVRMASALKTDRLRILGGLFSVWSLFDAHSIDGILEGYTPDALDDSINFPGFSAAMMAIKWLELDNESLATPRFDEHNGQSAKRRAQDADRKKEVRNTSATDADKKRTREEKNRDIKKGKKEAPEFTPGFLQFWSTWPNTDRKQAQGKCFEAWKKADAESLAAVILAHVERLKRSSTWTKNNGEYISAPLPYLNQRKWEGAEDGGAGDGLGTFL